MTLLVRDEQDIVGANLEYHFDAGVDFVIATDNGSVDATPEILAEYEQLGLLQVIHEPLHDYSQHRWVTHMARLAAQDQGADWVINNDADEFWIPSSGDLATQLAQVSPATPGLLATRENMVVPREGGGPPSLRHRFVRSTTIDGVRIGPKLVHRADPDVVVLQGNHEIDAPGLTGEPVTGDTIQIAHYPVRTIDQFERGVVNAGTAYLQNTELPEAVGGARRNLYTRYLDEGLEALWSASTRTSAELEAGLEDGSIVSEPRVADRLADIEERPLVAGAIRT